MRVYRVQLGSRLGEKREVQKTQIYFTIRQNRALDRLDSDTNWRDGLRACCVVDILPRRAVVRVP